MTLRLFNTLTGQLDELAASDGKALRMYACGPTVYDYGHIGNFRTFLQVDVLRRFLKLTGIPVRHVMNITDVDDKIIRNATAAGVPIGEYTKSFETAFFEDLESLRVERPEIIARATEHIPKMVALVQKLAAAGAAYKTEDGSWYFRLAAFPEYGKLSKKDLSRHGRRRAGGRGRVREGLGARLCAVEGGQARRDLVGYGDRARAAGLAHRVLGDGDGVPGRELRPARRRRRPDVSRTTKTRLRRARA